VDKSAREHLAQHVLAMCDCDAAEALVLHDNSALTRFTHNAIHQNVAYADTTVSIRAVCDSRTGVARTNALDDGSLRAAARRAIELAKLAPKSDVETALPEKAPYATVHDAYISATAQATAHRRAHMVSDVFEMAYASELWCAGFLTNSAQGVTVANSTGVLASFDTSDAGLNVKMNAADSTGYAEAFDHDIDQVDASAAAKVAASKATHSKAPEPVKPGLWTVILEPPAFGELFSYLIDHFSAQAYDEGSSFLCDGIDRRYMSENVNIWDDFSHPLAPRMPFDFEGAPTQRLALIENGIGRTVVTDSHWAAKLQRPNTGHALPAPNAAGPMPRSTVVLPGSKSRQELISETQRGLLVSRFWYIRPVDQRRTIVTGMTRDGTFLIEDGKIAGGVRNMRFNQSILEAMRSCELSNELRRTGSYFYSTVVPAVKIDRFCFSSVTDF